MITQNRPANAIRHRNWSYSAWSNSPVDRPRRWRDELIFWHQTRARRSCSLRPLRLLLSNLVVTRGPFACTRHGQLRRGASITDTAWVIQRESVPVAELCLPFWLVNRDFGNPPIAIRLFLTISRLIPGFLPHGNIFVSGRPARFSPCRSGWTAKNSATCLCRVT